MLRAFVLAGYVLRACDSTASALGGGPGLDRLHSLAEQVLGYSVTVTAGEVSMVVDDERG